MYSQKKNHFITTPVKIKHDPIDNCNNGRCGGPETPHQQGSAPELETTIVVSSATEVPKYCPKKDQQKREREKALSTVNNVKLCKHSNLLAHQPTLNFGDQPAYQVSAVNDPLLDATQTSISQPAQKD